MKYSGCCRSPVGKIFLAADELGLTELHFNGNLSLNHKNIPLPIFEKTKTWLDIYFSGRAPNFLPPIHMIGSEFQISVWKILLQIPFGRTVTYGEIAKTIAKQRQISKMSAQAVGGAAGRNKIPIIIPCHRVVGANGELTGYAGGISKKIYLLQHEKAGASHRINE